MYLIAYLGRNERIYSFKKEVSFKSSIVIYELRKEFVNALFIRVSIVFTLN